MAFSSKGDLTIISIPFALYAAEFLTELGFERLLDQVAASGGDSDTNASIAGQIAGASLGANRIPAGLISKLPDKDSVLSIVHRFAATQSSEKWSSAHLNVAHISPYFPLDSEQLI